MPLPLQAKLLRTLEDGEYTSVGADRAEKADVRIVAATNANLRERIGQGRFREDLYYRLARFTVETPPLRDRQEDIPLLAEHFLRVFSREMARNPPRLGRDVGRALQAYPFPGNVRELKNVIERALIDSGGADVRLEHLRLPPIATPPPREAEPTTSEDLRDLPLNLEAAERALIDRALSLSNGNVAGAARMLGVPRMRIYRRLGGSQRPNPPGD